MTRRRARWDQNFSLTDWQDDFHATFAYPDVSGHHGFHRFVVRLIDTRPCLVAEEQHFCCSAGGQAGMLLADSNIAAARCAPKRIIAVCACITSRWGFIDDSIVDFGKNVNETSLQMLLISSLERIIAQHECESGMCLMSDYTSA